MNRKRKSPEIRKHVCLSIVVLVLAGTLFVIDSTQVPVARAYNTPDTGVVWTLDDLVTNSSGAVTLLALLTYGFHEDVVVSPSDTLIVRPGDICKFDNGTAVSLDSWGMIEALGADVGILFTSNSSTPLPDDWYGIRVFPGGEFIGDNVQIEYSHWGLNADHGEVFLADSLIRETSRDGIRIANTTLTVLNSTVYGGNSTLGNPVEGSDAIFHTSGWRPLRIEGSVIIGGDGASIYNGAEGIHVNYPNGPIDIVNNVLIRGGRGGDNYQNGSIGGNGGGAIVINVAISIIPITINITGNLEIAGGRSGDTYSPSGGEPGAGGNAIRISDAQAGMIRIENNPLAIGGRTGDTYSNQTTPTFDLGTGGHGLEFYRNQARTHIENTNFFGGAGGDNYGFGNSTNDDGSTGGTGVYLDGENVTFVKCHIEGGRGGDSLASGYSVSNGRGGGGLISSGSKNLTLVDTEIYGGDSGNSYLNWSGLSARASRGGYGAYFDGTNMESLNSTMVGGNGGHNYGGYGEGGDGGYGLYGWGAFLNMTWIGGAIQGGRGGDNYNETGGSGGWGGHGIYSFYVRNITIESVNVTAGRGGDSHQSPLARGGSSRDVVRLYDTMYARVSNSTIVGNVGGIDYVGWQNGTASSEGVFIDDSGLCSRDTCFISGNLVDTPGQDGIETESQVTIEDNVIVAPNATRGINLDDFSDGSVVKGNTIKVTKMRGISTWGVDNVTISDNLLENPGEIGIILTDSRGISVNGTTITNATQYGVLSDTQSSAWFENCTIRDSSQSDFYVTSSSLTVTTLNTTFNGSNVYVGPGTKLVVKNYLDVSVLDLTPLPIQNADLLVTDDGAPVYFTFGYGGTDPQTDFRGEINWIVVTDRVYDGSSTATERITVAEVYEGARQFSSNPRDVDMSTSHREHFYERLPDITPPEILNVRVNGQPQVDVFAGTIVPLTATIDDGSTGISPITSANYTVGPTVWPGTDMNPVDGNYNDDVTEDVEINIDTFGWSAGSYDIWVYACDMESNCNTTGSSAMINIISSDIEPPQISSVMVNGLSSDTVVIGTDVTVTAVVDDMATGGSNILSANFTVGPANWGSAVSMTTMDAGYDEQTEDVSATISSSTLGVGDYDLCVYGSDVVPNHNVTSTACAHLTVIPLSQPPPEVSNVRLDGLVLRVTTAGDLVDITATITAVAPSTTVADANYTLGAGTWTSAVSMNPSDGLFDEAVEDVEASIDTSGWADGTYDFYVYASDSDGNDNTTSVEYATLSLVGDIFSPIVIGSPSGIDILVSSNITLYFNESMDKSSVEPAFRYTDLVQTWTQTSGGIVWTDGNRTMNYKPNQELDYGTTYIVTVNGSKAKDLAGNLLDGNGDGVGGDDFVFGFRTIAESDTRPPRVSWSYPDEGDTGVPPEADVFIVTFDEEMNEHSVEDAISSDPAIDYTPNWDGNVLTLEITSDLAENTDYTITINGNIAEDINLNPLDGNGDGTGGDDYVFSFRTGSKALGVGPSVGLWWIPTIILIIVTIILTVMLIRKRARPEEVPPMEEVARAEAAPPYYGVPGVVLEEDAPEEMEEGAFLAQGYYFPNNETYECWQSLNEADGNLDEVKGIMSESKERLGKVDRNLSIMEKAVEKRGVDEEIDLYNEALTLQLENKELYKLSLIETKKMAKTTGEIRERAQSLETDAVKDLLGSNQESRLTLEENERALNDNVKEINAALKEIKNLITGK